MTTWTLWLGALLVVGGSAALFTRQAVAARALWVLAGLAFAAAAIGAVTSSEVSLPLLLAIVIAIVATGTLVAVTVPSKNPRERASAQ